MTTRLRAMLVPETLVPAMLAAVGAALVLLNGCEPPVPKSGAGVVVGRATTAPLPPPPPPDSSSAGTTPGAPSTAANSPASPIDRADRESSPKSIEPKVTAPTPADSAGKPSIHLSVGLALPQTLPDGTQVGVSVDYKLKRGTLNASAKYVWVIESRKGETGMEVKLSPQGGNLAGFLPLSIRPGDSPFRARIDEVSTSGSRVCVSNVEPLR